MIGINKRYPATKAKSELRNRMRREQEETLKKEAITRIRVGGGIGCGPFTVPYPYKDQKGLNITFNINGKELSKEDFDKIATQISEALKKQIEESNAKR